MVGALRTSVRGSESHYNLGQCIMTCSRLKRWIVVILIAGCAGCELVNIEGGEHVEKTYPPALDLPVVDLSTVRSSSDVPDSFNVDVRVTGINVCPDNWRCIVPDGITIAEGNDDHTQLDTLRLAVREPRQFEVYQSYILTLEPIVRDGWADPFRLTGYSPIETVPAESR